MDAIVDCKSQRDYYISKLHPKDYIDVCYNYTTHENEHNFMLKSYYEAFFYYLHGTSGKKKLIDFGCGPVPIYAGAAISSGQHFQVVMSELLQQNRDALQKWMSKETYVSEFAPYFEFLAKISNRSRWDIEDTLRENIIGIEAFDLISDISANYGKYDVLISNICLEYAATSKEEYYAFVKKVSQFVVKGGYIMMGVGLGTSAYYLGETPFKSATISEEDVKEALINAGCNILIVKSRMREVGEIKCSDCKELLFICGKKVHELRTTIIN